MRSPEIIQSVCEDFLNIKPEILGHVFYDPVVEVAINRMSPALLQERTNRMVKCYEQIARKMMKFKISPAQTPVEENKKPRKGLTVSKSSRVM